MASVKKHLRLASCYYKFKAWKFFTRELILFVFQMNDNYFNMGTFKACV